MKISDKGIDLITQFEGVALKAYRCPANVLTIGIGETGKFALNGKTIEMGMTITNQQARDSFRIAIKRYEDAVNKLNVNMNQNQFDALVSFCYNLGTGIFNGTLLSSIKASRWEDVARNLKAYNKARVNGVLTELKGLTRRREAEAKLLLTPSIETPTYSIAKVKVDLFGETKMIDSINIDNTNHIKLRDLNCAKIKVEWKNNNVYVNGKIFKVDGILYQDNNYVKIRSLEQIGISVVWDNAKKTIVVK